jgi:hypothetical protein
VQNRDLPDEDEVLRLLEPDEQLEISARAFDSVLAVTDRRILVRRAGRLALNVPLEYVRRIEFDVERSRSATLVIVPESPADEPQVLGIPPEEIEAVAHAVAGIGRRLSGR